VKIGWVVFEISLIWGERQVYHYVGGAIVIKQVEGIKSSPICVTHCSQYCIFVVDFSLINFSEKSAVLLLITNQMSWRSKVNFLCFLTDGYCEKMVVVLTELYCINFRRIIWWHRIWSGLISWLLFWPNWRKNVSSLHVFRVNGVRLHFCSKH